MRQFIDCFIWPWRFSTPCCIFPKYRKSDNFIPFHYSHHSPFQQPLTYICAFSFSHVASALDATGQGIVLHRNGHEIELRVSELTCGRVLQAMSFLMRGLQRAALHFGGHFWGDLYPHLILDQIWELLFPQDKEALMAMRQKKTRLISPVAEGHMHPLILILQLVSQPVVLANQSLANSLLHVLSSCCENSCRVLSISPTPIPATLSGLSPEAAVASVAAIVSSVSSAGDDSNAAAQLRSGPGHDLPLGRRLVQALGSAAVPASSIEVAAGDTGADAASTSTAAEAGTSAAQTTTPALKITPSPVLKSDLIANIIDLITTKTILQSNLPQIVSVLNYVASTNENAVHVGRLLTQAIVSCADALRADFDILHKDVQMAIAALSARMDEGNNERVDDDDSDVLQLPCIPAIIHENDNQSLLMRLLKVTSAMQEKNHMDLSFCSIPSSSESPGAAVDLDDLWDKMSTCLDEIAAHDRGSGVISLLHPAIESFFMCHADVTSQRKHKASDTARSDANSVALVREKPAVSVPAGDAGEDHSSIKAKEKNASADVLLVTVQNIPDRFLFDVVAAKQVLQQLRASDESLASIDFNEYTLHPPGSSFCLLPNAKRAVVDAACIDWRLFDNGRLLRKQRREDRFLAFIERHKGVINDAVRRLPHALIKGPFSVLIHHSHILDFRVKEKYFREQLLKRVQSNRDYHGRIRLRIHRYII